MGQKKSKVLDNELAIKKDVKHNKARSQAQERFIAEQYKDAGFEKSRRVPMSGAVATLPADVDPGEMLLVECKESRRGSLRIDPEWIDQIRQQASDAGRRWYALHAWVAEDEANYRKVVVTDESMWLELLKRLKDLEAEVE